VVFLPPAMVASIVAHQYAECPPWWWPTATWPFQALYGAAWAVRQAALATGCLTQVRLPCPVVSVGNLTTGGTGKTPVVKALARHWLSQGRRVVILSRGYGATAPQRYARATQPAFGDEAFELQQALPEAWVMVGRQRHLTGAWAYCDAQPDVILLDDGHQYQRLARQANLVLVDARPGRGLGNGALLPTGPLREPCAPALRRATHGLATHAPSAAVAEALGEHLQALGAPDLPWHPVTFGPTGWRHLATGQRYHLPYLAGRTAVAVSGLADASGFEAVLREAGLHLLAHERLSDHAVYTPALRQQLYNQAAPTLATQQAVVATTAKDAAKWEAAHWPNAWWQACYVLEWEAHLSVSWLAALDASLWPVV
jgi:tetraacyldisaccharide 4'-kinase